MTQTNQGAAFPMAQRVVPVGASLGAISTLLSCLPLSFATAIGAATLSATLRPYRTWLTIISIVLLTAGFVQVYRQPRARRRWSTTVMLWISVLLVSLVLLSHLR